MQCPTGRCHWHHTTGRGGGGSGSTGSETAAVLTHFKTDQAARTSGFSGTLRSVPGDFFRPPVPRRRAGGTAAVGSHSWRAAPVRAQQPPRHRRAAPRLSRAVSRGVIVAGGTSPRGIPLAETMADVSRRPAPCDGTDWSLVRGHGLLPVRRHHWSLVVDEMTGYWSEMI